MHALVQWNVLTMSNWKNVQGTVHFIADSASEHGSPHARVLMKAALLCLEHHAQTPEAGPSVSPPHSLKQA